MKSLTLTLNLDHKVSNFSISLSAILLRSSFHGIPQNYSIINFKAVYNKTFKYKTYIYNIRGVFQRFSFVSYVRQINTSDHSQKNYRRT